MNAIHTQADLRYDRAGKGYRGSLIAIESLRVPTVFLFPLTEGAARLPLTARIERAHSDRARSASKKGTWLCPPSPWLLQKQSHCDLLPFDSRPTQSLNNLPCQHFRHFHQRKSIHHLDSTDDIRIEPGLIGNGPNEVARPDALFPARPDIQLGHPRRSPATTRCAEWSALSLSRHHAARPPTRITHGATPHRRPFRRPVRHRRNIDFLSLSTLHAKHKFHRSRCHVHGIALAGTGRGHCSK